VWLLHSMKKLLLTILFLILSSPSWATIALIANTCAGSSGGTGVTTTGINTTGASLIVLAIAYYPTVGVATPTDSVGGNTWNALPAYGNQNPYIKMYYAINPKTGTSQTFTESDGQNYPAICVLAFNGTVTTNGFDTQNGTTTSASTPISTGSITPTYNNEVLVSSLGAGGGSSYTIDSSFTIPAGGTLDFSGGNYWGIGIAYLIQTTATAENPTWNGDGSFNSATIASFKGNTGSMFSVL
jgi:hypothetical protein